MEPYDPLDYTNLARSVVTTLLERDPERLPPQEVFPGAGVYAIYYHGPFKTYRAISVSGRERPIYVGKAIPAGGRKRRISNHTQRIP